MHDRTLAMASLAALYSCMIMQAEPAGAAQSQRSISSEGQQCIACHEAETPSYVQSWRNSGHSREGVDCYTCHKADKSNPKAIDHNGFIITLDVPQTVCATCHQY